MADRHRIGGGADVVACIQRDPCASTLSPDDVEHVRNLAFAALAQEAAYLARHAEDASAGHDVCGEHAETTSWHVRRTFAVLDHIGWEG